MVLLWGISAVQEGISAYRRAYLLTGGEEKEDKEEKAVAVSVSVSVSIQL